LKGGQIRFGETPSTPSSSLSLKSPVTPSSQSVSELDILRNRVEELSRQLAAYQRSQSTSAMEQHQLTDSSFFADDAGLDDYTPEGDNYATHAATAHSVIDATRKCIFPANVSEAAASTTASTAFANAQPPAPAPTSVTAPALAPAHVTAPDVAFAAAVPASAPAPIPAPFFAPAPAPAPVLAPATHPVDDCRDSFNTMHVVISSESSSDEHAADVGAIQGTVHLKSSRCIDCRIVVSNGISAKHHGAPVGRRKALFEFCIKQTSAKCFVAEEWRTLMFAGLNMNSKEYEAVTGQQLEAISGASDHICVCVGFSLSQSRSKSGVLLDDCSLQYTKYTAIALHCILGLPQNQPWEYDEQEPVLKYEHPSGSSFVAVDDFVRLLQGQWVSDRFA
jgi:hypothetical protein